MTFIRYILIQIAAYAIDFGWFVAATRTGLLCPVAANAVGKVLAGIFGFVAHRYFTFRVSDARNGRAEAIKYFSLLGINIPLASGLLWGALYLFANKVVAKVFTDACLVLSNYWISHRFVFVAGGGLRKEGTRT
jgi:putative flippase GtrA